MSLSTRTKDMLHTLRSKLEIPSFQAYLDVLWVHFSHIVSFLPPKIQSLLFYLLSNAFLAFMFALPIYGIWAFESYHLDMPYFLGTILGALSFYIYLRIPKTRRFGFGFFVGIWWFWWVGLSFRFIDLSFLVPIIALAIALVYGVIFWILLFCECLPVRLIGLLIMPFITPFGFDWLVPQALLSYSYFGVDSLHICFLILALYALILAHTKKMLPILALSGMLAIAALDFQTFSAKALPTFAKDIELSATQVPQNLKWDTQNISNAIAYNFALIQNAIAEKKSLIILPETAFPFPLQDSTYIFEALKQYSLEIAIITGSIHIQEDKTYNSTFVFNNGSYQRIDKKILAPFGEYIPLPQFIKNHFAFIANMEFSHGTDFGYIDIFGEKIKNAICYEATSRSLYADYPEFVIATSNNAWFAPSIQPSLQKMLLKYYARLYQSTIFHSANMSKSAIITP